MADVLVDHEAMLAHGGKHILESCRIGKAGVGGDVIVFVVDLQDPCGRLLAERMKPPHELDAAFDVLGGSTPGMTGVCAFAESMETFAREEQSRELLAGADLVVVVVTKGVMKVFDVSYDDDGRLRRFKRLASGPADPAGKECELRRT